MWTNVEGPERLIEYRKCHPEILIQSNLIKKIYLLKPSSSRQMSLFNLNIQLAHFFLYL